LFKIYVDDIIFEINNKSFYKKFSKLMLGEFEMSMIREFKFFLGFQIKKKTERGKDIIILQHKYINEMLKNFNMSDLKLL